MHERPSTKPLEPGTSNFPSLRGFFSLDFTSQQQIHQQTLSPIWRPIQECRKKSFESRHYFFPFFVVSQPGKMHFLIFRRSSSFLAEEKKIHILVFLFSSRATAADVDVDVVLFAATTFDQAFIRPNDNPAQSLNTNSIICSASCSS